MAAFDFPSSPSVNQTYTANGVTWKWNGTMWMRVSGAGYLEKVEEGNSKIEVNDSGSGNITATVDGTEALRVDSSGRVLLGTTTVGDGSADNLTIADVGHCGMTIRSGTSSVGGIYLGDGTSGSDQYRGFIEYNHSGDHLRLGTNSSEKLRIDSDGRLLAGGATASNAWTGGDDLVIGTATSGKRTGITLVSGDDADGGIYWSDGGGANVYRGQLVYNHSSDRFSFYTAAAERLRITSAGQVKVGNNTLATPNGNADNFVIDTGDVDSGLSILSATTGRIYFGDAADNDVGSIRYVHTDNSMRFETAASERLRVFSDGSIRIGDNSINVAAVGGGPTLAINGAAPEITLRDSATNNPYAVMRTNDYGSLTLEADAGNNAANSTIHFRVDAAERMRINSSFLLYGDTASDLSGTHSSMFCGSNHAFQRDGNSGTYLTIGLGAANGTVDLEADARSGGYPDMRFITTNDERVRIRANGDMTMRGTNSQYVECASFEQTQAGKNTIVSNNAGMVQFNPLNNTNSTIISHSSSTNPSRITFPVAGAVHFSCYQDIITAGSTGYTQVRLYKNGVAIKYALITLTNGQWDTIMMNHVVEVAANDYLEVYYTGGTIQSMDYNQWCSYNFVFYPINTNRG